MEREQEVSRGTDLGGGSGPWKNIPEHPRQYRNAGSQTSEREGPGARS